jgi:hypothetical protein
MFLRVIKIKITAMLPIADKLMIAVLLRKSLPANAMANPVEIGNKNDFFDLLNKLFRDLSVFRS